MKGNLSKLSSWRVPWLWLTSSERDKTLRLSVPQKEVFNGWKRPAELIEELGRGSVTPDALKLPKTKVVMDLVQDITTDCSVIASICALSEVMVVCVIHLCCCYVVLIDLRDSSFTVRYSHLITTKIFHAIQDLESTYFGFTSTAATEKSSSTIDFLHPKHHALCSHLIEIRRNHSGQL